MAEGDAIDTWMRIGSCRASKVLLQGSGAYLACGCVHLHANKDRRAPSHLAEELGAVLQERPAAV